MSSFTDKKSPVALRVEQEVKARLATEVEKSTAQVLQNNKDFIYETNQALEKLAYSGKDIDLSFKAYKAEIGSICKTIQIEIENHRRDMDERYKSAFALIGDFRQNIAFMEESLDSSIQSIYQELASHDDLIETKKLLDSEIEVRKEETRTLKQNQENDVKRIYNALDAKDAALRKEIAEKPSEWPQIREEMRLTLDCFRIEIDGFKKENRILHRANFVLQKHIEDLYTQINKLKGE